MRRFCVVPSLLALAAVSREAAAGVAPRRGGAEDGAQTADGAAQDAAVEEVGDEKEDKDEKEESVELSRLEIVLEDPGLPFRGSDGGELKVIFADGEVAREFACDSPPAEGGGKAEAGNLDYLAKDSEAMALRRFIVRRATPSTNSFMEGMRNFGGFGGPPDEEEKESLYISMPQVTSKNTAAQDGTFDLGRVLEVGVEETFDAEAPGVPVEADVGTTVTVLYDCWRAGSATVEFRFRVQEKESSQEEVCLRWVKVCDDGFSGISLRKDGQEVYANSEIADGWNEKMLQEGTHESVAKFTIVSKGVDRLRLPLAVSNQPALLRTEVKGQFLPTDEFIEVWKEPVTFSVTYDCLFAGHGDITLTLGRVTLDGRSDKKPLRLTWKKHCGDTAYTHLQVFIKSDTFKNKTEAVTAGVAKDGFLRPCGVGSAPGPGQQLVAACNTLETLVMEVPPRDPKTTLELRTDIAGASEPPAFQVAPDVSFDRKIMHVTVTQMPKTSLPVSARTRGGAMNKDLVQTMTFKYICYKDAVGPVSVTIHILAHKPIEFAWKKRCVEPKAKQGKAFTAPQALVLAVFVLAIIGLIICLICFFCGKDEKTGLYGYEAVQQQNSGLAAREFELAGRAHKPNRYIEPRAEPIGHGDAEGEVVFH